MAAIFGLAAIGVELATGGTAAVVYDPFPTPWHVVLALLAPLAALYVRHRLTRPGAEPDARTLRRVAFANGCLLGIAGAYALAYAPAIPLFFIGIALMGAGALGFAPLVLTLTGLWQGLWLRDLARAASPAVRLLRPTLLGATVAVAGLGLAQLPRTATLVGLELSVSPVKAEQQLGPWLIEHLGDEEVLLEYCYRTPTWWFWANAMASSLDARSLYYRITGMPFDSQPRPALSTFFGPEFSRDWSEDWTGDWTVAAGEDPPPRARTLGLALIDSAIDVSATADGPVAYLEWTLVFENTSPVAQEARAQIAVPPGAVASRLTLWIDGEEREAAYGTTRQVTEAYEEVAIVQRRDPALLTWVAPDRLSLQCFPVPAGDRLKTKIGLSIPLAGRDERAVLALPSFLDRNFLVGPSLRHSLWARPTPRSSAPRASHPIRRWRAGSTRSAVPSSPPPSRVTPATRRRSRSSGPGPRSDRRGACPSARPSSSSAASPCRPSPPTTRSSWWTDPGRWPRRGSTGSAPSPPFLPAPGSRRWSPSTSPGSGIATTDRLRPDGRSSSASRPGSTDPTRRGGPTRSRVSCAPPRSPREIRTPG